MKKFRAAVGFGICLVLFGGSFLLAALCIVRTFLKIAGLTAWKAALAFVLATVMAAGWILGVAIYGASLLELRDFYRVKTRRKKVVHGEWSWTERGDDDYEQYWVCSKCGQQQYVETNYCPECGAKMDGGKDAEE